MHHGSEQIPRIAVFHAWLWLENPAGTFAADNWAIPYFRFGIPVPDHAPEDASKAPSLLSGGKEFVKLSVLAVADLQPTEEAAVEVALSKAEAEVPSLIADRKRNPLSDTEFFLLRDTWTSMWARIGNAVFPTTRSLLHPFTGR